VSNRQCRLYTFSLGRGGVFGVSRKVWRCHTPAKSLGVSRLADRLLDPFGSPLTRRPQISPVCRRDRGISPRSQVARGARHCFDQAGWHGAKIPVVPSNLSLMPLTPRAPELNGQENIWQFMRPETLGAAGTVIAKTSGGPRAGRGLTFDNPIC